MAEKPADSKKRGRSSSSSSSSSSGSSSSGSSSSGSRSSSSSSSSRSRSRSPRRRENRPARGGRSRSPIRRGSPPRGARADRGGNDRDRPRPSPSPPRRRRVSPSPPRRARRDRSGSAQRRRSSPRRSPIPARSASPIKRVVIKNLSKNIVRAHLEEIFSIYGAIKSVDLPPDRNHNHLHRGYGYVDYENVEDADKAIKYMDGGQMDGMIVQVEMTVGRQAPFHQRRMSPPYRRRVSPARDRKSPIRRGGGDNFRGGRSPPPRRRSPMGPRGSGANNMPLGPSRFRRGSRSRSPIGRRSRS